MFSVLLYSIYPLLSLQADLTCELGGVFSDEAVLCMVPLFRGTFSEAQSACAARGATLPYAVNSAVNDGLVSQNLGSAYVKQSFWLGKDPNGYKWLNGDDIKYSNWANGTNVNNVTCAALDRQFDDSHSHWIPQDCSSSLLIVCNYHQPPRFCNVGWSNLRSGSSSACYAPIYGSWKYSTASFNCLIEKQGSGELASIHSEAENEIVLQLLLSNTTIGDEVVHFWLGRKSNENGTASWRDGSSTDYTNYAPTVSLGQKNVCTTMSLNTGGDYVRGMWYTTDCDNNSQPVTLGAVCKTKLNYT